MHHESLGSEVAALAAEAKRLEDELAGCEAKLAAYTEAFARAQRTLLDAANVLRQIRRDDKDLAATIDACNLAALQPGVVEYSTPTSDSDLPLPWSVGAGRLSVELHVLTDLLALARAVGAEVGTFTVHELARIAGDLHASSYVEHSIALSQIHAILNNMPDTTLPMSVGATEATKSTVERVRILVDVLRKATDAILVGGAA